MLPETFSPEDQARGYKVLAQALQRNLSLARQHIQLQGQAAQIEARKLADMQKARNYWRWLAWTSFLAMLLIVFIASLHLV
jgi:hypothetical protein